MFSCTSLGPGGNTLDEKSSKLTLGLPISLVTEDTGSYRLEVRPAEKDAPAGRYELKIEERRAATAQDKDRIAAARASAEGIRFYSQQTAQSLQKAIEKYQEALTLWRSLGARDDEAGALNAIGGFHSLLRQNQKALDYYNQALPVWREVGDHQGEAEALNTIGQVYGYLGEHRKALDYFKQALPLRRAAGDRLGECKTLSNIGLMHSRLGEKQQALVLYSEALTIDRLLQDRRSESATLGSIGVIYSDLGEYQKGLEFFNQSLALARAADDRLGEAVKLNHVGRTYSHLGEKQKALAFHREALLLFQAIGDPQREAETLYRIARVERDRGHLLESRKHIEAALTAAESVRANVASQQLRASLLASVQAYYELHIDLLMRLHTQQPSKGFDAHALQASERARARSLLELLTEASAEIRQGVDPALLEGERSLQQLISAKAEQQTRLLRGQHTPEQAAAAAGELNALTTEYDQVQAAIRQTSPRYAALTQPAPLSLKDRGAR
jgi:tetratricopeptide (TPR) repeat protein